MNKRSVLLVFVLMIFLIVQMVSALKIDYTSNDKQVEDMKITFSDTILFGLIKTGEQGSVELKSHETPNQILRVGAGEQVTMFYDFNFGDLYPNGIGDVKFINKRTNKEVQRDYSFVYWGTETRQRDICLEEKEITNFTKENLINYTGCVKYGKKDYTFEGWLPYNSKDIPKGNLRIGLKTYVEVNDYIDGIWTIQGKEITKHASWTADLNTDLESYYKLDNHPSVTDSLGFYNGTNDGADNITGKINSAFDFETSNSDYIDGGIYNISYGSFSFSVWVKPESFPSASTIYSLHNGGNPIVSVQLSSGKPQFILRDNSATIAIFDNGANIDLSAWNHLVYTFDQSDGNMSIFVNGVLNASNTYGGGSWESITNQAFISGYDPTNVRNFFDGIIDEVGIWSRELTQAEITQLYNGGTGISYTDDFGTGLSVTLNSPEDEYAQTTINPINFNVTVTDDLGVENVTLYIDGVLNETNVSGVNGTYIFTKTFPDGNYNWSILAFDNEDNSVQSTTRTFSIDTTPFIEFLTPPTLPNYANITQEYIPMKVNVSTPYYKNNSFYIQNVNGTSFTHFYTNETYDINFTNLPDAHYHYNATICTTTNQCNSTETRHINHDVTPPEILIDSPTGIYNYLSLGDILNLNFTATDELANVSECWWNYNGTNNSVACVNSTLVSVPIAQEYGLTSANVYSNDTFGNIGFNSTTWNYKILELNKTFNNETTEGSYEKFYLYLNEGSGVNVQSVVLHYDGQTDSASLFSSGDNTTAMSELLIEGVSADINNTFYFTVTLTDSTTFNTTNATQLVRDISIDDCSSNPYPLLYLYLKDEEARTLLSGTIETNIEIINNFNYAQVLNISQEETSVNYVDLCSNILLNETDFLLNAEIRYFSDNHSAEFYHIQRADLSDYPANVSLFDLKTEDTTRFKVLYRNEDLIGVEGAILQLQRKYIEEGIFEVVEAPLTSSDSTGILHIDTNTNKYQITVVKNGEVLGLFQNLAFICESELTGECTLNLYDKLIPPNIIPLVNLQDFSAAYESSIDNQTITLTYVIPSGTAESVQVLATQTDTILGESTICNQTIVSSAGSIECSYSTTIQDSTIDYMVFKSGELIAQKGFSVQEDLRDDWGAANYILIVVFLFSLVFMALSSPEWIVINAVITVLISGGIWLIRGIGFVEGLGSLMWLIIGAIILISKLSKQEDF